jgi:hypothetical protein
MNVTVWISTKKMILSFLLLCMVMPFLSSCTDDDDYTHGVWTKRSALDGSVRTEAASFVIDNIGYICCGYKGGSAPVRLNDLLQYTPTSGGDGYWTQCMSMPTAAGRRSAATGFAVNGKGYVTTGMDLDAQPLKDTWEYDPSTDSWAQKDDFIKEARYAALGFSLGNYGYFGTGYDTYNWYKDFYKFDPTAASGSQWTIVTGYGGDKRQYGTVFIINNIAYFGFGTNNSAYPTDFWSFDGTTFTRLRDITDADENNDDYDDDYDNLARSSAVAFVIDGKGYVCTGTKSGLSTDYWKYNPETDLWTGEPDDDYTPFALLNSGQQGSSRSGATAFTLNNRGFVVAGASGSYRLDDMYELSPYEDREE